MRTYILETGTVFIDHDVSSIKEIKWVIDNEYWGDIKFEIPKKHGSIKGKQVDVVESFMLSFENVEAVEKMINGLSEVANLMHKQQKEQS